MFGLPGIDTVRAAAANVAQRALHGPLADHRRTPSVPIDHGRTRTVLEYAPRGEGQPVLLVPPLGVPSWCFDLRRGCSMAEHLVDRGRPTYLLDYGDIGFGERDLGLEHWVDDVVPNAIAAVHERTGEPVHVVGWCFGGIVSVLAAARMGAWPIASLTIVASPFDTTAVPLIAPLRPLVELTGGQALVPLYRTLGTIPAPLVRRAFQVSALGRQVTKPLNVARNLADRDYLAQVEAVERFTAAMVSYPGRVFAQVYHRFFRANELSTGSLDLRGGRVDLAAVKPPTLVIAGRTDTIAPPKAVRRLTELLPEAAEVRFATVTGGHLGALTGRAARQETWPLIDRFHAEVSG